MNIKRSSDKKNKNASAKRLKLSFLFFIFGILLTAFARLSFAVTPAILFSDFTDAPVTGWNGSGTQGAAVTIWGTNLGASRGSSTVTVCGVTLNSDASFAEWGATSNPTTARGLQRITFWLNSSMTTGAGTIQVGTSGGLSGTVPFYCRAIGSNHIYFLSTLDGNDTYNGTSNTHTSGSIGPWLTAGHVRASMTAGDVAYFRGNGSPFVTADTYGGNSNNGVLFNFWYGASNSSGTANNSINISSYPGEVANLGNGSGVDGWNQYDPNSTGSLGSPVDTVNYWTVSKMNWVMPDCAVCSGSGVSPGNVRNDHNRWVGNEMQTSSNSSISGSVFRVLGGAGGGLGTTYLNLYGNYLHDAGGLSYLQVYNLYFGAAGYFTHIDVGWNEVAYSHGGRGVQIYCHSTSDHIEDFNFHDNFIHDNAYTGVIFGGGDGNAGVGKGASQSYNCLGNTNVWNNIIAHNGWDQYRTNTQDYPGIFVCNTGNNQWHCNWGNSTPGTVRSFWNNTFYNNGLGNVEISDDGTANFGTVTFINNINVSTAQNNGHYIFDTQNPGGVNCLLACANWSNNLYFGPNGLNEPTPFPDLSVNSLFSTDPKFANATPVSWADFNVQSSSPAINKGIAVSQVRTDFNGFPRPSTPTLGSFEYSTNLVIPSPPVLNPIP